MNPEVSLVKEIETLPSEIMHQPKGSVVVMPKFKGPLKGKRGRTRIKPVVTASVGTVAAPDAGPVENEDQKRAFDFYLLLGSERSVVKVADHFSARRENVYRWCRLFDWKRRVRLLENQPDLDVAKRNLARYYKIKTGLMVIPDPNNPTTKKIANPDFSVSAAKEITAGVVALDKNTMDKEAHQREMEVGPRGPSGMGGRNRGGVMVNVVIQK